MKTLMVFALLTLLLLIDYCLYVTGNVSITYSLLGGWFIINNLLLVGVFVYTVTRGLKAGYRSFVLFYVCSSIVIAALLYYFSDEARDYAQESMHAEAVDLLASGLDKSMYFTNETSQNFEKLLGHDYQLEFETFIPTRRRIDHLLRVNDGTDLRLVLIKRWNNSDHVYLGNADM